MALQVTCDCGQAFTVHAERGPAKVSCFMCGRKFTVDRKSTTTTGTDLRNELSTAIYEKQLRPPPAPVSSNVSTSFKVGPAPRDCGVTMSAQSGTSAALQKELRQIDLEWQIERLGYRYPDSAEHGADPAGLGETGLASGELLLTFGSVAFAASLGLPLDGLLMLGNLTGGTGRASIDFCRQFDTFFDDRRRYLNAYEAYLRRRLAAIARHNT